MANTKESSFLSDKQASIIFERDNGTVVELVASYFPNFRSLGSLGSQFGFYALVDEIGKARKVVTPEKGEKSLNGLSVDEYVEHGRVGLMSVVRPHELFKVSQKLENKLKGLPY